jgi:hypothetical protein
VKASFYQNIKTKFFYAWSHGLLTATLLDRLSRLGIKIVPYYLFEEQNDCLSTANIKPIMDKPYETVILERSDINLIKGFENLPQLKSEFSKLWDKGCSCVCLTSEGSILGYGWFDLATCNYKYLSFELKSNEAYSFNFHTVKHMRGRNIAPFLRNFLAAHVQSLGRNRRYSITEKLNTPAMKFKEKRNAKPLSYYVYVSLFNRFSKNIRIKTMKNRTP